MGIKLENPPAVYVLCQVIFNTILDMENFVPKFQEAVRVQFPRFKEASYFIQPIVDTQNGPDIKPQIRTNWHFIDKKNTSGYLLNANSLTFHTTKYDSFESLKNFFISGLKSLHSIVNLSFIERSGLRYINAVQVNETSKKYFHNSLLGMDDLEYDYQNISTTSVFNINTETTLKIQSFRSKYGYALPNDISRDLEIKYLEQVETMMLDFDCIHKYEIDKLDIDNINESITIQHDIIENTFKKSIDENCFATV